VITRTAASLAFGLSVLATPMLAQHDAPHAAPEAEHAAHAGPAGRHRLTLGLGHSHVINSVLGEDGELKNQALPSWSLNYDYWLSDRWAIGVQTDVIIESFVIQHGDEEILEREYPVFVGAVGLFKPFEHFSFVGGIGFEHAPGQTLTATRLGVEFGTHLGADWEVGAAATWDAKWNYYDAWGLNFTVSRFFGSAR
jgi:hypothetical protein